MSLFNTRVFPHPNLSGDWKCPICKKPEDRPVVLFPILGTQSGNNMQAEQIHADCLEFGLTILLQV